MVGKPIGARFEVCHRGAHRRAEVISRRHRKEGVAVFDRIEAAREDPDVEGSEVSAVLEGPDRMDRQRARAFPEILIEVIVEGLGALERFFEGKFPEGADVGEVAVGEDFCAEGTVAVGLAIPIPRNGICVMTEKKCKK